MFSLCLAIHKTGVFNPVPIPMSATELPMDNPIGRFCRSELFDRNVLSIVSSFDVTVGNVIKLTSGNIHNNTTSDNKTSDNTPETVPFLQSTDCKKTNCKSAGGFFMVKRNDHCTITLKAGPANRSWYVRQTVPRRNVRDVDRHLPDTWLLSERLALTTSQVADIKAEAGRYVEITKYSIPYACDRLAKFFSEHCGFYVKTNVASCSGCRRSKQMPCVHNKIVSNCYSLDCVATPEWFVLRVDRQCNSELFKYMLFEVSYVGVYKRKVDLSKTAMTYSLWTKIGRYYVTVMPYLTHCDTYPAEVHMCKIAIDIAWANITEQMLDAIPIKCNGVDFRELSGF